MLKQLKNHHREIARLSLQGFSPQEIAEKTGSSVQNIYSVQRDPMYKSFLAGLNDKADEQVINVRKKLIDLNPLAVDTIKDILSKDSNAPYPTMLAAAKDILDRNGYKAPEKHEHVHGHFTAEDLANLRKRANIPTSNNSDNSDGISEMKLISSNK